MSSHTNHEKRIWEDTPAGKLEVEIKKIHNKKELGERWTNENERWIDIHRATTMSKERDLFEEYNNKAKELEAEHRKKFEDFMLDAYQKELDYLHNILA